MLVSQSPPVFSHSPPTNYPGLHTSYNQYNSSPITNCRSSPTFTTYPSSPSPYNSLRGGHNPTAYTNNNNINNNYNSYNKSRIASPRRPCLVIRTEETVTVPTTAALEPSSPGGRLKKRVVFADDRGMSLTHIRVMREPSNVPPLWSIRFLAEVTQGICAEPVAVDDPWIITFQQPAAEYLAFRERLDTLHVSLENVIVRETDPAIVGTIKVSNRAYEKEVFLRYTTDNWTTYKDHPCTYVSNNNGNSTTCNRSVKATTVSTYVVYDTFSFRVELPSTEKSRQLDFCVCFRSGVDEEYWDNNNGKNYSVVRKVRNSGGGGLEKGGSDRKVLLTMKCAQDVFQAKVESWSEFASWTHLENTNPYW